MHRQLTISVGLIERGDTLLITRRHSPNHPQWHQRWEFPGGKIAPGETPEQALHRELLEETGLQVYQPRLLGVHTQNWQTPTGTQQTFILVYSCRAPNDQVILRPEENDHYSWESVEAILGRADLLEGTQEILNQLYLPSFIRGALLQPELEVVE